MGLRDPHGVFSPNPHRSFKVVDIIADYLRLLWERMEVRLNRKFVMSEIKWSLTIPAIWSDAEKAAMRKAAFKAGLIPKEDISEDHFVLILEPEAAAAWCLEERKKLGTPLVDGESFLVVDAGGGTVDLTSHMIVGGKLKELTIGSGGPCGSSEINAAFWKYLQEVICNKNLDTFRKESPLAELELTIAFEQHKCQVEDYSVIRYFNRDE
jgi:molecular chaperone DnaK (HSP70)